MTEGKPYVETFTTYGVDEDYFLQNLVSIEKHSAHPLAISITNHFSDIETIELETKEVPGIGVEGIINGERWLVGRFEIEMCKNVVPISMSIVIKDIP